MPGMLPTLSMRSIRYRFAKAEAFSASEAPTLCEPPPSEPWSPFSSSGGVKSRVVKSGMPRSSVLSPSMYPAQTGPNGYSCSLSSSRRKVAVPDLNPCCLPLSATRLHGVPGSTKSIRIGMYGMVFSLLFPRVDSSAPGNGGVAPCKTGGWRQTCHQCVDLTIEYLLLEQKHTPKMQSSGLIPVECLVSNQKCSGLPKNARPLPGIQATWPASFFCRKFDAPALSRGHCTAGCGFMARTGS